MPEGRDTRRPPTPAPAARVDRRAARDSHDDSEMIALLDDEQRRSALLAAELQDAREALATAEQEKRIPTVTTVPPTEKQRRKAQIHVALLKLLGALTACAAAVATYLGVTAHTVTEPKVDNLQAKTQNVETVSDVDHKLLLSLREELHARNHYQDCVNGQFGSAILYGTGRLLTVVGFDDVTWKEQHKPPLRAPVIWESWAWKPEKACPDRPESP